MRHENSIEWTPERVNQLKDLLTRADLTREDIQKIFGITKSALNGAIYRHIDHSADKPKRVQKSPRNQGRWDESSLTEKWEDRKARRAKEKAEA